MPRPFEPLAERLLESGVAPRHVRRYLRELEEHLDDLIAAQIERGYSGEDAFLRAHALLGPDEELAAALLAGGRFRSLTARVPWLVFGVVPPVLLVCGLLVLGVGLGMSSGLFHARPIDPLPAWCGPFAAMFCEAANFGIGPLAAIVMVLVAERQRLPWRWPVLGAGLAAFFSALTSMHILLPHGGARGAVSVGLGTDLPALIAMSRFALTAVVALALYGLMKRSLRTV